jgi:hypothetical protein
MEDPDSIERVGDTARLELELAVAIITIHLSLMNRRLSNDDRPLVPGNFGTLANFGIKINDLSGVGLPSSKKPQQMFAPLQQQSIDVPHEEILKDIIWLRNIFELMPNLKTQRRTVMDVNF